MWQPPVFCVLYSTLYGTRNARPQGFFCCFWGKAPGLYAHGFSPGYGRLFGWL